MTLRERLLSDLIASTEPIRLPGTKGDLGEKGDRGLQGSTGKDGERGPEGPRGPEGAQGSPGSPGQDGKDGTDGQGIDRIEAISLPPDREAQANWHPNLGLLVLGIPRGEPGQPGRAGSVFRGGGGGGGSSSSSSGVLVSDEGTDQGTASRINFTGAGVSASTANGVTTVTIAGGESVFDDYLAGENLEDQTGANAVLTFTFSKDHQLVLLESDGDGLVARANAFGGIPDADTGTPLRHQVPLYLPVNTSVVRVYAPTGTVISCSGFRRTV